MKTHRRRIVALLASNLAGHTRSLSIYDVQAAQQTVLTGEISPKSFAVFDPARQEYVVGRLKEPNVYSLMDLASYFGIDLRLGGDEFSGIDHETGKVFHGALKNGTVMLFDQEEQSTFEYRL